MGGWTSSIEAVPGEPHVDTVDFSEELLVKYEPLRKIGSGAFGSAYMVRERTSSAVWCAKKIKVQGQNVPQEVGVKLDAGTHTASRCCTLNCLS